MLRVAAEPECNACGMCCGTRLEFGQKGGFVRLSPEDVTRLPEKYRLRIVKDSDPGIDRLGVKGTPSVGYRCVALRGVIGSHTSCDAYEGRPAVCRQFERGSADCRKERAAWLYAEDARKE